MNLTKRMLQFSTVCAGVCALSASATQYVGDSFEDNGTQEGTNGMPVAYYKATLDEFGAITDAKWVVTEGDASALAEGDADNQAYAAATRPMSGVSSNLVLNLSTEGQTLSRTVDNGPITFTTTPVWVDTLIKFTASEDAPSSNDLVGAKAAVYVDANAHLMVYHGNDNSEMPTGTADLGAIDTNEWHRLTINLSGHPLLSEAAFFQVWVDGTLMESSEAYPPDEVSPAEGGTWFMSAVLDTTISSVAFKGTGKVDELVVTDEGVTFIPPNTGILLTLSFNDALVAVTQGGNPVANGGTVDAGAEIVIDATDWYEIASVTGVGDGAFSGPVGAMINVSTGLVSATAADTLTITAQQYTGSVIVGDVTIDGSKMSAWAIANNKTEAQVLANGESWYDDYLCNVAPDTNPQLEILSIVIDKDATPPIAIITVGTTSSNVAFDSINGTLKVSTRDELGNGDWSAAFEGTVSVQSPNTTATVEVDVSAVINTQYFIKAVIE